MQRGEEREKKKTNKISGNNKKQQQKSATINNKQVTSKKTKMRVRCDVCNSWVMNQRSKRKSMYIGINVQNLKKWGIYNMALWLRELLHS